MRGSAIEDEGSRLQRWGWYSIGLNVGLVAAHGMVTVWSGSLAVAAELVHNVVDLISAVAVLVGLKLATRTSPRFPYGMHKVENLVALGLAMLVSLTAYEIGRDVILGPAGDVETSGWMLVVVIATTAAPLVFSQFELRVATAANSPALIADAREYRVHVATTGLVFASLAAGTTDFPVDRVAAACIIVVVAKTGWDLFRDAMSVLLDASLDRATLDRIEATILADPAVSEVQWLTGRNAGRFRFVESGVTIRVADVSRAEVAIDRIEGAVRASVPHIDRVLVHVEAPSSTHLTYGVPLAEPPDVVSEQFGAAPLFALVSVARLDGAISDQELLVNPYAELARGKGIRVAEWLVEHKVDVVLSTESLQGRGPAHVLGEAGVRLHQIDETRLGAALAAHPPSPSP